MMKTLLVTIHLDEHITRNDLTLRQILVSTIENKNLADVIEETSSAEIIEVVMEVIEPQEIKDDLIGILTSLGFNHYEIEDITAEE